MRSYWLLSLLFCFSIQSIAQSGVNDFTSNADRFFKEYVSNGKIDYASIKENSELLDELLKYLEEGGPLKAETDTDKAVLINAYNLFVIKGIVENYPTKSPMSISGFFDNKIFLLSNKKVSLNQVEKDILIKETKDARLHFVLVCAAIGCPKIAPFAYSAQNLEDELNERTKLALNDNYFVRINDDRRIVELSQIFYWYKSDFTTGKKSLIDYVNQFRENPIPENYKVRYYEYDWSLNVKDNSTGFLINQEGTTGESLQLDFTIEDNSLLASTNTYYFNVSAEEEKGFQEDPKKKKKSNLLRFTPSRLFGKGQYEINNFNNLYSQTEFRNSEGESISTGRRNSILTSMLQFTYGVSENSRINIGVDLIFNAGSIGNSEGSSAFQIFGSNTIAADFAVAHFGPRIKWQPFRNVGLFSIQSTFLFPIAEDLAAQDTRDVFLVPNRYVWLNQFFYDQALGTKFRLFFDFSIRYNIRRNVEQSFFPTNFLDLPITGFLNYFPNPKLNLFINAQYNPRLGNTAIPEVDPNAQFGLLQWYWQVGGGAKYQVSDRLSFELSYGNFVASRGFEGFEAGAGQVFNLGIRFIK